MSEVGLRELLEAGVHFGHQTRRWNPRMGRYIHGERDGIHIIDLLQTQVLLQKASAFGSDLARKGATILFVGTKKQARDAVGEMAQKCGMPYVNQRWLGGLLTNFSTISKRIDRLHELTELSEGGRLELLPTKERMARQAELAKLEYNLGGVRDMKRLPQAVFLIDLKTEEIALREAARLRIPIIGLVDTNCDPNPVSYVVPGNDDAIRSCELVIRTVGDAIAESASAWRTEEERRRAEEERKRAEEAERKRRAEEERKRAEEAAKQAEAAAAAAQAQQAEGQQQQQPAQPPKQPQQQPKKPKQPAEGEAPKPRPKPQEPAEQPVAPRIPAHPQAVAPDAPVPPPEDAQPKPEDAQPKPEDAQPKPEDAQPKPEDAQPKPEDAQPKPEDAQPAEGAEAK